MQYNKPKKFHYRTAQMASLCLSTFVFKRRILRNEIKGKKGAFVVIANHEAALDFVNLITATRRPMSFVISKSFFNTLPVKKFMTKMGVIPKQQFQTQPTDLKQMKAVLDAGEPVVIYPAGLMCEDGLSTPIPSATYKFLKWLDADVYVAKTSGTYFVMPKWSKKLRPGRTYLDVYKLFSREELSELDLETVKAKTDEALLFDAYREQENVLNKYNRDITGLENVLYMCPHCKTEFSMQIKDKHTIYCTECGFEQENDKNSFMHKKGEGEEIRYASDWSKIIYSDLKDRVKNEEEDVLTAKTAVYMVDSRKNKFVEVGNGEVTLSKDGFVLDATINGEAKSLKISTKNVPTLPFSPGKHIEIQDGQTIYRCVLEDGRLATKFINMVKIFYELREEAVICS